MKKIKILLCIAIIIICVQVTYSRYLTQLPDGTISASTGKAIVNLEYIGIADYVEYQNRPSLTDSSKKITYNFKVNNYTSSTAISNVDLKPTIYIVFYNSSNDVISSNVSCTLKNDSSSVVTKTATTQSSTINVNGSSVTLPSGTFKFSPTETLQKNTQNSNTYHLTITPNIESLPASEIIANMKIYCSAEQPL